MLPSKENQSNIWKKRWRSPVIRYARISSDNPDRGFVTANIDKTFQLYAWDVPKKKVHPLTDLPGGVLVAEILRNGEGMIYHRDESGDEIGHYYYVPFSGSNHLDLTPDLDKYSKAGFSTAYHSDHIVLSLGLEEGFATYVLDGVPTENNTKLMPIYTSEDFSGVPELSQDGHLLAIHTAEYTEGSRFSIAVFDTSTKEEIAQLSDGETCSIECWGFSPLPNDERLMACTDRSGYIRPLIWNPVSGKRTDFDLPDLEGDIRPLDWMPDGKGILLMQTSRAKQYLHILDIEKGKVDKLNIPPGSLGFLGGVFGHEVFFTPDGRLFALIQDAQTPGHIIELDLESGEHMNDILCLKEPVPGHPLESIEFTSEGNNKIQGWLGKPTGGSPPYPTIIHTHGGPEAVMTNAFLPLAQAWIDNGYLFLSVNYRGSTTFGKEYKECIWGQPGIYEVEDILAARTWLIGSGLANPDQIFLTGYSYGGYLTLQTMGKAPGYWAGGIALAAISDWVMMHELSNPNLKSFCQRLFLGLPEDNPGEWKAASPVTYANDFDAPILIIQGSNDSRTPAEPIRLFENRLKELNKEIEVLWYEAGHVGPTTEQWIEFQQQMIDFANSKLT